MLEGVQATQSEAEAIWSAAYDIISQSPSLSVRDMSIIKDISPSMVFDSMIVLVASNDFTRIAMENQFEEVVESALSQAAGRKMNFVIKLDAGKSSTPTEQTPQSSDTQTPLTPTADDISPRPSVMMPTPTRHEPVVVDGARATQDALQGLEFTTAPTDTESAPVPTHNLTRMKQGLLKNRDEISHLNKDATFDNFVPGESNRFARAAAFAVAEAPGSSYNPLFIYGGSGLGKTHLLNAIGNYSQNLYPDQKTRYVNSEEFTNEFIEAVKEGAGSDGTITEFNRRYREVDLLLIDDIQFLSGKTGTLETFFHTFNALYGADKQIVVASDVAPKLLQNFEQRLISRFEMGLTVDVQPPNQETRIAILRMKASASNVRTEVPGEVLDLIAQQVTDNIRELEGALTRVEAMASLNKQPVTLALAEQTLQDYFVSDVQVTPTDIISHTAAYFQLTFDDLVSSRRSAPIALARQVAMYICREMTGLSLTSIGEIFGGRDHTTVIHAYKRISSDMSEQREVYNYVQDLTSKLKQRV